MVIPNRVEIREFPEALAEEETRRAVAGHVNIGPAVAIEVGGHGGEGIPGRRAPECRTSR